MTTYLLAIHVVARCVVIWSDESLFEFVLIFLAPLFVAIHAVMHVQSSLSCARDSANARDSKERAYISSDKLGNLI